MDEERIGIAVKADDSDTPTVRRFRSVETHLFVGRGYLVSVRHGASTSYTPVRERCEASPKNLSDGEDFILYAILDFIVDNYMPVIDAIQTEVEEIDECI